MKKILILIILLSLSTGLIMAQSPEAFNYQAVARNDAGEVIASQNINIRISILKGTATGTVVFSEEHSASTNGNGLFSLRIGRGTSITGSLTSIDWSSGPFFIKVEMDETGGTDYKNMGTSQLLSVPYAQYADSSGNTFSGNYSDLSNTPELGKYVDTSMVSLWDKDSTDDFSGKYEDLMNKPSLGMYVDTSMTKGWDKDTTDDFSGVYDSLINKPDLDIYVDTAMTAGWDKDTADDFSGVYDSLRNKPNLSDTSKYISEEKDPVFSGSVANDISSKDTSEWSTSYWNKALDTLQYKPGQLKVGSDTNSSAMFKVKGGLDGAFFNLEGGYSRFKINSVGGLGASSGFDIMVDDTIGATISYDNYYRFLKIRAGDFDIQKGINIYRNHGVSIDTVPPEEKLHVNGAVRVEDTTSKPRPKTVYGNSLPLAYGFVLPGVSDADLGEGSYGIKSVRKNGTGDFTVTVENGWKHYPAVNITVNNAGGGDFNVTYDFIEPEINVYVYDSGGNPVDRGFSLVVYGQPK